MTKTTNYQLNQWDAADPIRREDFNRDNAAFDAAIAGVRDSLLEYARVRFGTYAGDGAEVRVISLGYTPRIVILWARGNLQYSAGNYYGGVCSADTPCGSAVQIVENGFQVAYDADRKLHTNYSSYTYYYLTIE